jgi:hypothetical protein
MRRKGEISYGRIRREWPHHVALPADKVMGKGYDLVHGFAGALSVAPRTLSFRLPPRGDHQRRCSGRITPRCRLSRRASSRRDAEASAGTCAKLTGASGARCSSVGHATAPPGESGYRGKPAARAAWSAGFFMTRTGPPAKEVDVYSGFHNAPTSAASRSGAHEGDNRPATQRKFHWDDARARPLIPNDPPMLDTRLFPPSWGVGAIPLHFVR